MKIKIWKGLITRLPYFIMRVGLWWDYKHQLPVVEVINLLFFILLFVIVVCKSVFKSSIISSMNKRKVKQNSWKIFQFSSVYATITNGCKESLRYFVCTHCFPLPNVYIWEIFNDLGQYRVYSKLRHGTVSTW